jgi:hypothetical protein
VAFSPEIPRCKYFIVCISVYVTCQPISMQLLLQFPDQQQTVLVQNIKIPHYIISFTSVSSSLLGPTGLFLYTFNPSNCLRASPAPVQNREKFHFYVSWCPFTNHRCVPVTAVYRSTPPLPPQLNYGNKRLISLKMCAKQVLAVTFWNPAA